MTERKENQIGKKDSFLAYYCLTFPELSLELLFDQNATQKQQVKED
jgi:hypothetical protein